MSPGSLCPVLGVLDGLWGSTVMIARALQHGESSDGRLAQACRQLTRFGYIMT